MAFRSVTIGPFPGGLNTRDAAGELSPEEIADALNVTIDERGAVDKRLGYERRFTAPLFDLITNPGAEVDLTGWAAYGGSISRVTTEAKYGAASIQVVAVAPTHGINYGLAGILALTEYTYGAWVKCNTGGFFNVQLSDGIDQGLQSPWIQIPAGEWTFLTWTGTTDTHTGRAFYVQAQQACTFFVDGATVNKSADTVTNLFAWNSRGWLISQEGPRMHKDNGAAFHTWSTSARVGMCEYLGNLIMIHPVDGVRMYDGTTVTGPFTNFPVGTTCAAWQNKCYFGGDPANPSKFMWTDIGAMTMGVNNFNQLREKDNALITCLTGASGLDVSGRPGLLAFKGDSAYRIYDSSNGAYNTIDASVGCSSNIAAVSAYGRTYVVNERGIYWTDGINPMVEASGKIENTFHRDVINQTRDDLYCAGRFQDRLWFSLPRVGETRNSLAIELNPTSGWVMVHDNAGSCYASVGHGATDLVMGSPDMPGLVYNTHRGGTDDGAPIASRLKSAWLNPAFGNRVNLRRARFIGTGEFDATLLKDFESSASLVTLHVDISTGSVQYDDPNIEYDTGETYGPGAFQGHQDFYSVAKCREFSILIEETSSLTRTGQAILGGAEPELGAWGLSRVLFWVIDLGMR